jgi:hypothetical protein
MKEFMHEHPWMTFFLGLAAINGVATIVSSVGGPRRSRIPPPIPHNPVAQRVSPQHYTGAVNRGGFGGNNGGMPMGPGPWPTNHAAAPVENGQTPDRPMMPPGPAMDMTGWGHGEMPTPFGVSAYGYRGWPAGGGGHGGYPYSAAWWE